MNLAREELRAQNYSDLAVVLARTAIGIGAPITYETEGHWVDTVTRLAEADDLSEITPELLGDPVSLLNVLDINDINPQLVTAATDLLTASRNSRMATTLPAHFTYRAREARGCINLLRFQSPDNIRDDSDLWRQLGNLTVFGTYFDSFVDCREDAQALPQFTPLQLARGSMINMAKAVRAIRPETLVSCARACQDIGLGGHIAKRLAKPLLGSRF